MSEMSAPKLRFKEYSTSWEVRKLGAETVWGSGGTPSKQNESFWDGDIPWISASAMRGTRYADSELKITKHAVAGTKLAQEGDLLLLVRGSMLFNKIPVGIAKRELAFNQDVKSIRVKSSLTPEFLLSWFLASENKLMNMVSCTGIGAGKLDTQELLAMDVWLPLIAEQTKIANFLTAVDEKISQLTRKCDLLAQYKKGVMQQIFSQELRFKDENGEEFPDWDEATLGSIASFSKGKGISKADIAPNGTTPCIRYGELYTEYGESIREVRSRTSLNPTDLIFSEANDVIIPASGETQIDIATASCVTTTGVALGGDLNIIRANANGIFLAYYLNNEKRLDIAKLAQGNSVVHLYSSQLKHLALNIPAIGEQTKIANFLTAIDDKITHAQAQLAVMKQWKQGLLQQMFV